MRRFLPLFSAVLIAANISVAPAQSHAANAAKAAKAAKASMAPAIGGYCPVAYAAVGKAIKGDPKFASMHDGHKYLFVNADAKKAFDAEPGKFKIAYDGWCATAVAENMKVASDPTQFTVHEGRSYLFSSADAKKMFDAAVAPTIEKAEANWPKVKTMKVMGMK